MIYYDLMKVTLQFYPFSLLTFIWTWKQSGCLEDSAREKEEFYNLYRKHKWYETIEQAAGDFENLIDKGDMLHVKGSKL